MQAIHARVSSPLLSINKVELSHARPPPQIPVHEVNANDQHAPSNLLSSHLACAPSSMGAHQICDHLSNSVQPTYPFWQGTIKWLMQLQTWFIAHNNSATGHYTTTNNLAIHTHSNGAACKPTMRRHHKQAPVTSALSPILPVLMQ